MTAGDSVTFGVWLAIDPRNDRLRSLTEIWWDDDRYAELQLDGWLANDLPQWGLLGAPVVATVRNTNETPYCVSSSNETLARVLAEQWDRDVVLTAIGER